MKYRIKTYAPGNGSLSFVRQPSKPDEPCGPSVTMRDARKWLKTKEGQRYIEKNWHLKDDYGHPKLVKFVERIDENHLTDGDGIYEYSIDPEYKFICDAALHATFEHHIPHVGTTKHELKNLSIRMTLLYFLNEEKKQATQSEEVVV